MESELPRWKISDADGKPEQKLVAPASLVWHSRLELNPGGYTRDQGAKIGFVP